MAVEQRGTTAASGTETLPAGAAETPYDPELSYRAFLDPRVVDGAEDESGRESGRKGQDAHRSRVVRALGRALDALP